MKWLVGVVLALALAAAGCGGADDESATTATTGASGATGATGASGNQPVSTDEAVKMLFDCVLENDGYKISFDKRAKTNEYTVKTPEGEQIGVGIWPTRTARDQAVNTLEKGGATVDVYEAITVAYAPSVSDESVSIVTACVQQIPQE